MNSLKDVYIDQLQDLHSANKQAMAATRELAKAATNNSLRQALERGVEGIGDGCDKLKQIIHTHDAGAVGTHCKGMEGLVREAQAHALKAHFSADAARDAVIISQYQRMAHYAIAGYGCTAAFARQLDLPDDANTLQEMLDAAYSGDKTMSGIAEEKVNARAT